MQAEEKDTVNNTEDELKQAESQQENAEPQANAETAADETPGKASKEELLERERDEFKDKYIRLYAEFDNFKRRTLKEKADWFRDAKADVISALLPVLDDFDRARVANASDNDLDSVKEGFDLIHQKMFRILEGKGLKSMDSMNQDFNTDLHEAITNIPAPSDEQKGKVVDVVEKGYTIDEHIIRFAKVVVGQ